MSDIAEELYPDITEEDYYKEHPNGHYVSHITTLSVQRHAFKAGYIAGSGKDKWIDVEREVLEKEKFELEKALRNLVSLKNWKDEHGKDSHYEQFQPEAWSYAKGVLDSLTTK